MAKVTIGPLDSLGMGNHGSYPVLADGVLVGEIEREDDDVGTGMARVYRVASYMLSDENGVIARFEVSPTLTARAALALAKAKAREHFGR